MTLQEAIAQSNDRPVVVGGLARVVVYKGVPVSWELIASLGDGANAGKTFKLVSVEQGNFGKVVTLELVRQPDAA